MESKCGGGNPGDPCCGGGADRDKGLSGSAASCDCGTPAGGRRRLKTWISGIVILAALGVGVVSLVAGRSGSESRPAAPPACCPATVIGGIAGQTECGGCPSATGSDSTQVLKPAGESSQAPSCGN